jgi:hypothetical protein
MLKSKNQRNLAVPDLALAILYVEITGDTINLLLAIALAGNNGAPVSGLPNLADHGRL